MTQTKVTQTFTCTIPSFILTTTVLAVAASYLCSLASSGSDCDNWSCEMGKWLCEHVLVDQIVSHDHIVRVDRSVVYRGVRILVD